MLMVVLCINIYTYMYNSLTSRYIFLLYVTLSYPLRLVKVTRACVCVYVRVYDVC